jgi:hypothetical protein
LLLLAGLAFAQPGVKVTTVGSNGSVTATTITAGSANGPGAKAPTAAADGSAKYWDGLGIGGTSTNYFTQVPYITATPNPQIAAGPDDILTIVNRTISRYPNPNAAGNTGTLNPYNYPPTEFVPLDVWMGLSVLGSQAGGGALCPSGTGSNSNCVIDNASVRYDQLQGRFVVLFTVTDLPAHRSNWVLIVSTFAQFTKCSNAIPPQPTCTAVQPTGAYGPLFTPPVIAPIVGGNQTGGQNPANWVLYKIPINLLYNPFQQPSALGLVNNPAAVFPFNNRLANSAVGTLSQITVGGASASSPFLTTLFCPNGGPTLPLTYATVNGQPLGAGGTGRNCTNYYPTGARFGIDNDNIILTAPVLDQAFSTNEGRFPSAIGQSQGPYAGTRVTTIAKIVVYNGTALNFSQPGNNNGGCLADAPIDCQAVNLSDNAATGTLTEVATKVAFAQGIAAVAPAPAGDLQYGSGGTTAPPGFNPATPNSCFTSNPVQVPPTPAPANPAVLSCAPTAALPNALPAIFWEPDNLRGRALASFDAQVAPFSNTTVAGVITPIDYLVGTEITGNFGLGIKPQGVPGVTGQPGAVPSGVIPPTAGIATIFYVQPIAFSCPGSAIFGSTSGVTFCGAGVPGGQSLVADLPFFGPLRRNVSTLAQVADPSPVGQGFSATQMTTNPLTTPVSSTANNRIFTGDSRPAQVMFREGLLYVARTVRLADLQINWLGTSTVLYDILKTCATGAAAPACGAYSVTGSGLGAPALALETEWFNGVNVPDPLGDLNGFGFYQPMFESPADVVSSGPVSPINLLPWFDKLFVGMTTGGTKNTAGTFSPNFPSLWDFRPGDDAYDTVQPYLDPYTGNVFNTYNCANDVTLTVLAVAGNIITVDSPAGLAVGMFLSGTQTTILSISGSSITLSASFSTNTLPTSATFTRIQPVITVVATLVTPGSNQVKVASATGLQLGQVLGSGANVGSVTASFYTNLIGNNPNFGVDPFTNVAPGETVTAAQSASVTATIASGSPIINVPLTAQVGVGGVLVVGSGIPPNAVINNIATDNAFTHFVLTLSQNATFSGSTSVVFDTTNCFVANTFVTGTINANTFQFFANGLNIPGVTVNNPEVCADFGNGLPLTFNTGGLFPAAGTTIVNINGNTNTITLSSSAANPLPGLGAGVTTANVPLNFVTAGSIAQVTCPIIPFSQRGGASTDPNDGSLWLYGEFARNRLSTIPGPGQWGTSVANYALSFPAVDPYNNDNIYFQDVQPTGSPDSSFFAWIQLAKNLGLAVPSSFTLAGPGGCTTNGAPPILQPPGSGATPTPGPSQLACLNFGPDTIVTRAEIAYWVVKAQMDEAQITNYLCATGGDPSGLSPQCNGAIPASTFADLGAGGGFIVNPFLAANPALGIPGVTNAQLMRYIEVMARRGYTKGCNSTADPTSAYCPNQPVTRAQMSVFLIRAKMNNVFPTTLSGIPLAAPYGDNFGYYQPPVAYFTDVTATDPVYGPYYLYIQKMRELRITNGTGGATFSPGNNLTRKEIATFVVRAFFL